MTAAAACLGAVVIVEDEEDSRELLRELLEGRGYRVATAGDGIEALDVLQREHPVCFVVLDLVMPRMDGFEVLKAIAADSRLSRLRIAISTSAPDQAPAGLPCLPKPVDIDRLFTLIDEHCAAERCIE